MSDLITLNQRIHSALASPEGDAFYEEVLSEIQVLFNRGQYDQANEWLTMLGY